MPHNLLIDPVAPFLLASGEVRWLAVADIVTGLPDGDHAVEPAWPRADLDTATYELLIGVLSFALAPKSLSDWCRRYHEPPSPDELRAALVPLVPAFNVDGEGPLFMQEQGLEGEPNPVEALFIDTPGANAQKKNSDLLTHRSRYGGLCMPAAAMALFALQAFAPAGGAGIRTSLRGGGPLTAIVIPQGMEESAQVPLWRRLWANVAPLGRELPARETVFPWLRPYLPVGKERGGVEIHAGAPGFDERLHPFFAMPRRIRLVVSGEGRCGLTGREGPLVTGFLQKPYGLNYGNWLHPLTPYRRQKAAELPYSLKPKSGRFGYRDWVAVTLGDGGDDETSLSLAAANVRFARGTAADTLSEQNARPDARVRVAGWAMNNMEAISYLAAEQPLPLADASTALLIEETARKMAEAGDQVSSALRLAIRTALGVKEEKGVVDQARTAFYADTDDRFHELLAEVAPGATDRQSIARRWLAIMRSVALGIFDGSCPVPIEDAQKAEKVVKARAALIAMLAGRGKGGGRLFGALDLPPPAKADKLEESPA